MRKGACILTGFLLAASSAASAAELHSSFGIDVSTGYRSMDAISVIDWGIAASYAIGGEIHENIALYGKAGFLFDAPAMSLEPFLSLAHAYGVLFSLGAMFRDDKWLFDAEFGMIISWMNGYPIAEFVAGGSARYRFASLSGTILRVPVSFSILAPVRMRFSGDTFGITAGLGISVEMGSYA